jgi:heat shock protein HslJ
MEPVMSRSFLAVLASSCLLSACSQMPPDASPEVAALQGATWRLTRLHAQPIDAGDKTPSLRFDAEGQVTGFTGCNRLFGRYRLDGARIVLGQMALTQMACLDGMTREQDFLQALKETLAWKISGTNLFLHDAQCSTLNEACASMELKPAGME